MASIYVNVDACEFDDDELVQELESRGYMVLKTGMTASDVSSLDLPYIEHLSMCGLHDAARQEALGMIGRAIGRSLAH